MQDISLFIHHHSMLSLALAAVLALLIIVELMRMKRNTNQISPTAATTLINHQNAVVVDLRNTDAFVKGHIVDAISLPFKDINDKYKKIEKFKSQPIVLVCSTGIESPRAETLLTQKGFNVFILAGGIRAWQTADLPLIKG
jgi:rhodanese-related sulfurtransferase